MPRQIIEEREPQNGLVRLVSDPHDFSNKPRWFVECQIRFPDEATARAFYDRLHMMATFFADRTEQP